ncbi:MAG: hypothetical protein EZS28_031708 [Streblomastix strix]|uniref:Uncharacterized protein n=1 Tax=Streblomastix strix TaxID=222440 RepID=A0A5J4USP1_9EUKA|nr:MAG: hypothetical protein EZS28_031708 [Streblomastix strix]
MKYYMCTSVRTILAEPIYYTDNVGIDYVTPMQKSNWLALDCSPSVVRWIKLFNGVLDSGRTPSQLNGKRIMLANQTQMIFDADSVSTASPAIILRCGVVHIPGRMNSLAVTVESWLMRHRIQN